MHKKSACKTFQRDFSESVKVFHGSLDAEGHQFSMQPARAPAPDQERMINFNASPKRLPRGGWGWLVGIILTVHIAEVDEQYR